MTGDSARPGRCGRDWLGRLGLGKRLSLTLATVLVPGSVYTFDVWTTRPPQLYSAPV